MYLVDFFYGSIEKFNNRTSIVYRYTYKALKVLLNIFFPIIYKNKVPNNGRETHDGLIVSFTSFPARIETAWETAYTLLCQTVKPTHVILWLANSQFEGITLPKNLTRLEKYGLEIRFCDDLRSHKKYYESMKLYPDAIVITADDDVFYPSNWIDSLLRKHEEYPQCVICNWAHRIKMKNGKIMHYEEWDSCIRDGDLEPSDLIVPVGYAGVLYPPHSLDPRVFNKDCILSLCITADDLWLKANAYLNGIKAIQVKKDPIKLFAIIRAQEIALFDVNVGMNQNDAALENILTEFEELKSYKMDEKYY